MTSQRNSKLFHPQLDREVYLRDLYDVILRRGVFEYEQDSSQLFHDRVATFVKSLASFDQGDIIRIAGEDYRVPFTEICWMLRILIWGESEQEMSSI